MREFVVKRGKFQGVHKIYDTPEELFEDTGISFIRKPWSSPETKSGDWCQMDDGFIMQCLHRSKLITKKTGKEVDTYRFPVGSRAVYYRKRDNTRVAPCLYTTNPSANKSAMVAQGYDRSIGGSYDARKKLWVNYVAGGLDPLEATMVVYRNLAHNKGKMISITNKLLENLKIREYLMTALVPFKTELENQIAEATGGSTLNETIAIEIAKLIGDEPKSQKDKIAKIKLLIDVAFVTGNITKPNSNTKVVEAEDTQFKEVIPPTLGSTTE